MYRRAVDLEEIVNIAEAHQLQIATVASGDVDLSTPTGRMNARIIGAVAQGEVERTQEQVVASKKQAVAQGRYRGGPRPYGYAKDGVTVCPAEAKVIQEVTAAVLSGRSLAAVARELNLAGRRTSTGNRWTYSRLGDVLIRPKNAGLLHRGRAARGAFEIVGQAPWPAIVERETWEAVHGLLTPSARRLQEGNRPKWLGSGVYRCGH